MVLPKIIQGGMGVGVSNWRLARAVSLQGQLGVVSGTLLPVVLARRLQQGDPDSRMRRALEHFPLPAVAARIIAAYYKPGGLAKGVPFALTPMPAMPCGTSFDELAVAANFAEVFLAKEGHDGLVGVNLLEKIRLPTLPSLYGAMLAGVDFVLMGAGIPRNIPGALDLLAAGGRASLRVDVTGDGVGTDNAVHFDPRVFMGGEPPVLARPRFLAIVGSSTLALTLARKSNGRVDGFVVESAAAGGHNAPPRGPLRLSADGEPIYGDRDLPDVEAIRALGLPFWLAGSQATPAALAEALAVGASGVQIGTAFAFCDESGVTAELKRRACALAMSGLARVRTDSSASPTGMPFKVLAMEGTASDETVYRARPRACDLGYLREAYRRPEGGIGYRCPAEPEEAYVRKHGDAIDCLGRKCLCNGLLATVGLGQSDADFAEPALITAGQDVAHIGRFLKPGLLNYSATDVIAATLRPSGHALRN